MAEPAAADSDSSSGPADQDAVDYLRGGMPVAEQDSTYRAFDGLVRFGSLGIASLLLFLVLMFCTGAGFFGAVAPAVILAAAGGWFLRKAPPSIDTL